MNTILRILTGIAFIVGTTLPSAQGQVLNFEDTWKKFLQEEKTVNISQIARPSKNETYMYLRWCLMFANNHFCANKIEQAEELMMEIEMIGPKAYGPIPGFAMRYDDLVAKIKAYHAVDALWTRFLRRHDVTLRELDIDRATEVCELGTLAKHRFMLAQAHFCAGDEDKAREDFERRVMILAERTSLKIEDVDGLPAEISRFKVIFKSLTDVNLAWKDFMVTGQSIGFDPTPLEKNCNPIPAIKGHILKAASNVCELGTEALVDIDRLRSAASQSLPRDVTDKIAWLKNQVATYDADLALLDRAWKEFMTRDTLRQGIDYPHELCRAESQIRSWILDGAVDPCNLGQERLERVKQLRAQKNPVLDASTLSGIRKLEQRIQNLDADIRQLDRLWATFIAADDTLNGSFTLLPSYCDATAQIKAWTMLGHFDPCSAGHTLMGKIVKLRRESGVDLAQDVVCSISRLDAKIWDCRYWELVAEAKRLTEAERNTFGPLSATVMEGELNSGQHPCFTTVSYMPMSFVGIRYLITAELCEQSGDGMIGYPALYRQMVSWVQQEVLGRYCEGRMRCTEEFYVYAEGHTEGGKFPGARYFKDLDIPIKTPYLKNDEKESVTLGTRKAITTELKSNHDLAVARAWAAKEELEGFGVDVIIGTWEHSKYETGQEFKVVKVELNLVNLLMDFYEKTLARLLQESGIGERPDAC